MNDTKINCPVCGAEMNHHATKIEYSIDDGVLEEVYTCPNCGDVELKQAE